MRLLDLCCCEGLGAWGYWRSGRFSEIVGVDINPEMRTRYSFDFVLGDCLALTYDFLLDFDFIHASPPCQAYSQITPDKSKHQRLIPDFRLMLEATGKPFVIENVEGSKRDLRPNLVIDGGYFGLPIERRRYFYVSLLQTPERWLSRDRSPHLHIHGGNMRRRHVANAMGLDIIPARQLAKITQYGMEQGIPPAFTKGIAQRLFDKELRCG